MREERTCDLIVTLAAELTEKEARHFVNTVRRNEMITVSFAIAGVVAGFVGTSAHDNYVANHPEQATQCITTDISTANSDCKLAK